MAFSASASGSRYDDENRAVVLTGRVSVKSRTCLCDKDMLGVSCVLKTIRIARAAQCVQANVDDGAGGRISISERRNQIGFVALLI